MIRGLKIVLMLILQTAFVKSDMVEIHSVSEKETGKTY